MPRLLTDLPPLTFLDFETTQSPTGLRSVEVGWLDVRDGVASPPESRLVQPGCPIDPFSQSIHGISDADVARAPRFDAVWEELRPLLHNRVVLAHNAAFDAGVLRGELARHGFAEPDSEWWCTLRLARCIWPRRFRSYSLGSLCRVLMLQSASTHRAGDDAAAAFALFCKAVEALAPPPDQTLEEVVRTHARLRLRRW